MMNSRRRYKIIQAIKRQTIALLPQILVAFYFCLGCILGFFLFTLGFVAGSGTSSRVKIIFPIQETQHESVQEAGSAGSLDIPME